MVEFVTEYYIRNNTPLSANLDVKDIVNNIGPASDMHIQPVLGTPFYNDLLVKYSAQTLSVSETQVVALIQPALAYWAAEMSVPFINYQIKNKGAQTQNGDFSNNVEKEITSYLRNELKNRAEFYTTRLENFLCLSGNQFTLYVSPGTTDMQPDKTSGYDSGFATYQNGCGIRGGSNRFFGYYGYPN